MNRNSDGDMDIVTSQSCNIFTGLFENKHRVSHGYKYTRNALRYRSANETDTDNLVYDYSIEFFERKANDPYRPVTTDEAAGLINTTITYSHITEVQVPEKAYAWQYQGAECARPDFQNEYQYYISAIIYGSVSSFDYKVDVDKLKQRIFDKLCTDEQEKSLVYRILSLKLNKFEIQIDFFHRVS